MKMRMKKQAASKEERARYALFVISRTVKKRSPPTTRQVLIPGQMIRFALIFLCGVAAVSAQDAGPDPVPLRVLEKKLSPALEAYQAGDAKALQSLFAKA